MNDHYATPPPENDSGARSGAPRNAKHIFDSDKDTTRTEECNGADSLTVLTAHKRLAKTLRADGSILGYDNAKNFRPEQRRVTGIAQLSALLSELEPKQKTCVVRGRFVGIEEARERVALDHPDNTFRQNELFDDQPLHALMIEVDDFEPLTADPVLDPVLACREYITTQLPPEFSDATFHWQLSNSAGHAKHKNKLKVHLWLWLRNPYTSAQLKAWASGIDLKADHSVFQKIQIHYTAAPIFEAGVEDPVPVRSGFVKGATDEVDLNIDAQIAGSVKAEKPSHAEKIKQAVHRDPIAQFLIEHGHVKSRGADGKLNIVCPFEDGHSGDSSDSSTVYMPAWTNGHEHGSFDCKHDSCSKRSRGDFLERIGYEEVKAEFVVLAPDATAATAAAKTAPFDPNASRIGDVFSVEPPAPAFAVRDFYPLACGQENAIGGAGKTTRRMYEGVQIILGRPLYGHVIDKPGAVAVVTKEDSAGIFKYRLHHVAKEMGLSPADQRRVGDNFHVIDLSGDVGGRLVQVDRNGNLQATDLAERIYRGYRHEGLVQVSFDPWNLFGPGERFVNDAEASLIAAGALISRELACNVCYVGHVSKQVGRQGTIDAHSGRGGAAMGDNARFVLSYVQHTPGEDREWAPPAAAAQAAARGDLFRLHVTKQSYAKRDLEPVWIERRGYAFTVHEGAPASAQDVLDADGARVQDFVQQELAQGVKYQPDPLAEQHERYSLSRPRARTVISRLLASGGLVAKLLPATEQRTRRKEYLMPVFQPVDLSCPTGGDIGEGTR